MAKKNTKKVASKSPTSNRMYASDYRKKAATIVKPMKGDFAVTYFVYFVIIAAIGGVIAALSFIDPMQVTPSGEITGSGVGTLISSALAGLFTLLTSGAFAYSLIYLSKQARWKHEKPKVSGIFYGFKERYTQSLGIYIVRSIFTVLWTLLLIIPGIIKSYAYSMSLYIALDNPNMTTLDCITESRKLMKGHKWQLFCLEISYIGWILLTILTLGILSFWVMPKFNQAHYEFYLHISNKD